MGYTAAIIKITSHCKSLKARQKAIEYIRHDCNQVENELGQDRTIDEAKADAAHWKKLCHRGARTSTQMVISFKRGTNVAAAQETVRAFAAESFAGHQYVIGWHTEKKGHPHAHLVTLNIVRPDCKPCANAWPNWLASGASVCMPAPILIGIAPNGICPITRAVRALGRLAEESPRAFVHWQFGHRPRLDDGSRMS